ncbi:hypothetical protein [Paenibacillus sp. sgz302251]|uniref:hypothetical protein n=1 Tax=Paenibacillus sp. sgz302251 TaxID=3414493 RepID=UPI003C7E1CF8
MKRNSSDFISSSSASPIAVTSSWILSLGMLLIAVNLRASYDAAPAYGLMGLGEGANRYVPDLDTERRHPYNHR